MNYGTTRNRKAAQQLWAVGEQVKVGFLSLRIVGRENGYWLLVNKDATKKYTFRAHEALVAVDSFKVFA